MNRKFREIGKTAILLMPPWSPLIPPLGIVTVAEIFRSNGIDCYEFDWNTDILNELETRYSPHFNRNHPMYYDSVFSSEFWLNASFSSTPDASFIVSRLKEKLLNLINSGFISFGFSVYETNRNTTKFAVAMLRGLKPDCMILLGGPGINNIIEYRIPQPWLSHVDYVFYKEVENSLPDFIKNFGSSTLRNNIPGTAYLSRHAVLSKFFFRQIAKKIIKGEKIQKYRLHYIPAKQKVNVADIPPLNMDHLDLSKYKTGGIPLEFSRGCTGSCSFCSETIRFRPYRPRPVSHLIRDIQSAVKRYHAQYFCLICSTLNGDVAHLKEFCLALINQNIHIKWGGNARPDETLNDDMLQLMATAGCHNLDFGLESGSNRVLKLMNKQLSVETASSVIHNCHKFGIKSAVNLIVGFPGESDDDFQDTIRFIENHYSIVEIFNVSKCFVDGQAQLGKKPDKFNIFLKNGEIAAFQAVKTEKGLMPPLIKNGPYWSNWASSDFLNTPFIRETRYQQVLNLLDKLRKRGNTPHDAMNSSTLINND